MTENQWITVNEILESYLSIWSVDLDRDFLDCEKRTF